MTSDDDFPWRAIALLGVIGAGIRVAVVLATTAAYQLNFDAADYDRLGWSLARGHGWGLSHVAAGGGPTALRPPAWPMTLAGLYTVVGHHVAAGRLLAAALGGVTVGLTATMAWQLGGCRSRALAAGALAAVLPAAVIASTTLMSEALFIPMLLTSTCALLQYRRGGGRLWLLAAGASAGLAILTRPLGAVVLIGSLVLLLEGAKNWRAGLAAFSVVGVVAGAPCLLWEARDVAVMHAWVPLTTQGPYTLAGTYNATAAAVPGQPGAWLPANIDPAVDKVLAAHPKADEVETARLLQRSATGYLKAHPAYLAVVVQHNVRRLFDLHGLAYNKRVMTGEFGYGRTAAIAELLGTWLLLVLAFAAVVLRAARGLPWALWVSPAGLLVITAPLQGFSRFRTPVDPFLIVLAAALWSALRLSTTAEN